MAKIKEQPKPSSNRGGARAGAGRKPAPEPKETIYVYIRSSVAAMLATLGDNNSTIIEQLISAEVGRRRALKKGKKA